MPMMEVGAAEGTQSDRIVGTMPSRVGPPILSSESNILETRQGNVMCRRNRIRSIVIGVLACLATPPVADAQQIEFNTDCPYPPVPPIYARHQFHGGFLGGGFIHIGIEPIVPIQVFNPPLVVTPPLVIAPPVPVAPLPAFRAQPRVPLAAPGQIENFAKPAVPVVDDVMPENQLQAGVQGVDAFDELAEIRRRVAVLKRSTPARRDRADRLISNADEAFAEQNYARAVALYRDAIARAPDYAEAHFRLAHAYVATRRYNLALKSALMALELSGTSRRNGFSLAELYRGNKFARERHDEMLLDAALREPEDGGLKFLIGFTTYYAPNPLKAREHFRESMEFPGAHQAYVRQFLPAVPIADADDLIVDAD